VSAYLTSVEERARQAEVRAAEARLKHRVTLMSAGAGLLVLALAAGGWTWVDGQARARRMEAAQRVASATSAASGARGRAQSAKLDTSLWSTAVASAEQLVSLAGSDDVDSVARADADTLLATVREESRAASDESERQKRDVDMLAQLELARIPADEDVRKNQLQELRRLDAAYAQAFATYLGEVPLFEQGIELALASMRRGSIGVELAASLDHWGLVRDKLRSEPDAPDAAGTARVREIAMQLDSGDAWRTQLRALLPNAANESVRLRELADHADFAAPTSIGCRVLSQALWSAGEKEAAIAVLRRGQEMHSQDFGLCFQLALCLDLLDEPRPAEAFEVYRIAHAIRPERNEVLHRQVLDLEALRRHADAERLSRLLVARDPLDPHWLHHLGNGLDEQERFEEAIACDRRRAELEPASRVAHANLGFELSRRGDLDQAVASYRRALELDPSFAMDHFNLGYVFEKQGRSDDAIACYRKAIELDPKLALPRVNLATLLQQRGELEQAIESYRSALELDPKDEYGHRGLGLALEAQGRLDEAIASFRRALELWSGDAVSLGGMGRALWTQGDLDAAIECFQRLVELDPRDASAQYNLGACLAGNGQHQRASIELAKAAELFAQDPSPFGREWLERSRDGIAASEQHVAQSTTLSEVLEGRTAVSMDEWNAAVRLGYDRQRYSEVVSLAEATLRDAPELIGDGSGLYDSACCAARLAASADASVAAEARVRARERARTWLERDVERRIAQLDSGGPQSTAARASLESALEDADFAGVRAEAIDRLPDAERAAWRDLWKRIAAGVTK